MTVKAREAETDDLEAGNGMEESDGSSPDPECDESTTSNSVLTGSLDKS
jgi:hypothetical protein